VVTIQRQQLYPKNTHNNSLKYENYPIITYDTTNIQQKIYFKNFVAVAKNTEFILYVVGKRQNVSTKRNKFFFETISLNNFTFLQSHNLFGISRDV